MYFAGKYTRFEEGQQVYFKVPDSTLYLPCTINSIGVLGTKLSANLFLYNITCNNGKTYQVTEEALSVDCNGNRQPKKLCLNLKYEWYEKIKNGEKTEEYRAISAHWAKRFLWFDYLEADEFDLLCTYLTGPFSEFPIDLDYINKGCSARRIDSNGIPINDIHAFFRFGLKIAEYQYVEFRKGYTKETMQFDIDSIKIGKGDVNMGAPEGKNVFIIKLGKAHDS